MILFKFWKPVTLALDAGVSYLLAWEILPESWSQPKTIYAITLFIFVRALMEIIKMIVKHKLRK